MKRRITFLALCSLIMANAYSQEWSGYSSGKIYPGYIIKTDGTKVEEYIEGQALATPSDSPFGNSNQSRVVYTAKEGIPLFNFQKDIFYEMALFSSIFYPLEDGIIVMDENPSFRKHQFGKIFFK